jgi:hypothetical protein
LKGLTEENDEDIGDARVLIYAEWIYGFVGVGLRHCASDTQKF